MARGGSKVGGTVTETVRLAAYCWSAKTAPWGFRSGVGGRSKFEAPTGETDQFPVFLCAQVLGGGGTSFGLAVCCVVLGVEFNARCAPSCPRFSGMCPHFLRMSP